MDSRSRSSRLAVVSCVAGGSAFAMLDFFLFGVLFIHIGRAFFPAADEVASRLVFFMTLAGLFFRLLGAVVLGIFADQAGRSRGFVVALSIMALGTILIACTPSYATIGPAATVTVVVGRLLQAFSLGGLVACVSIYLFELATPGHKGFYTAWQPFSGQAGILASALMAVALGMWLSAAEIGAWGWRIPVLIGCLIAPFIFLIRRSLAETPDFLASRPPPRTLEALRSIGRNLDVVAAGTVLVSTVAICTYLFSSFLLAYGITVLKLANTRNVALVITATFCLSCLLWMPIMGALADRFGSKSVLAASAALMVLTTYPAFWWFASDPEFVKLLLIELWLSFVFSGYSVAATVALAQLAPARSRVAVFSLAYGLATALFGAFAPVAAADLARIDRAAPMLLVTFAAGCCLLVVWSNFLFSHAPRITRSQFWLQYCAPAAIIGLAVMFADIALAAEYEQPLKTLCGVVVMLAGLVAAVKRCHDRDRTGWFVLIYLIPVVGWIWLIGELGFLPGTAGANRFGPEPVGAARAPARRAPA
ncbi:MAG TPA: MFS transporter [Xanthobacteraceae bacterium]|nr:MFS transporter [Xanthobacteraceae bacterium]